MQDVKIALFWRKCLLLALSISLIGISLELSFYLFPYEYSVQAIQSNQDAFKNKNSEKIQETLVIFDWLQPKYYWIDLNQRVLSLQINGTEIRDKLTDGSDNNAQIYDLSPFLTKRINILHVVKVNGNNKSKFYLYPSIRSTLGLVLIALMGALAASVWFFISWLPNKISLLDAGLFSFGSITRLIYAVTTPYFIRNHDLHGHLVYIYYLMDSKRIPAVHYSWESFQPPLYYIISAILAEVGQRLGANPDLTCFILQLEACAISIAIMACCIWISNLIFDQKEKISRLLFCLACAVCPSLIFESNQINNDVLVHLISFLFVGLMLTFCSQSEFRKWLGIAILLGIGLITKTSTLALVAVALLWLCFFQTMSWAQKFKYSISGMAIIVLLAGWFHIPRWVDSENGATFVVGNLSYVNERGKFDPTIAKLIAFDPIRIIEHPFIQSIDGDSDHGIFGEYYFKSAFFGQWLYGDKIVPLAQAILFSAVALIPVFLMGCRSAIVENMVSGRFLFILMIITLAFQLAWIWQAPFTSSEDFRYFTILIIPSLFFVLNGARTLPGRIMIMPKALLAFVIVGCFSFVVLVFILQQSLVSLQ